MRVNIYRLLYDDLNAIRPISLLTRTKGGFLFTSVTSCLQWYGTQTSHWSAPALFYSSLIFSLLAVVNGSQQILLLPETKAGGYYSDRDEDEARSIQDRLRKDGAYEVKRRWLFALQAPMMLLTLSVMTFLAGLCSVIFSPLAHHLAWNSEAKVSLLCVK